MCSEQLDDIWVRLNKHLQLTFYSKFGCHVWMTLGNRGHNVLYHCAAYDFFARKSNCGVKVYVAVQKTTQSAEVYDLKKTHSTKHLEVPWEVW